MEGQKRECDLIYRKQELLEFSICCVPTNPFACTTPNKTLKIERVIQDSEPTFYEKMLLGLARA
ncbi:MAG: hypothetical protein ACI4LS_07190 [Treponema sp.]